MSAPYEEPGGSGVWLTPPVGPRHDCLRGAPVLTPGDFGRRWRCTCGKVYQVDQLGPGREQGQLYLLEVRSALARDGRDAG